MWQQFINEMIWPLSLNRDVVQSCKMQIPIKNWQMVTNLFAQQIAQIVLIVSKYMDRLAKANAL